MNRLSNIARSTSPSGGVQFRDAAYGVDGAREFLRDLLAIANAPVEGNRYIVVGVDFDSAGRKRVHGVGKSDFAGKRSYQALANEFIEPPVRVHYQPITIDDKQVGVYEIADCQDRPYMMRIDHSETLRRGDAYVRKNNAAIKMGRRQLQAQFEAKFRESVSAEQIEIGFPGEIIHKDQPVPVCDLDGLPSAVAGAKLQELVNIKSGLSTRGSTSMLARLTHARLFGSDNPYEARSKEELLEDMQRISEQYAEHDAHFLFEEHARKVQIVVYNQGDEPIRDASISMVLPNHSNFHVASALPAVQRNGKFVARSSREQGNYPSVNLTDDSVHITGKLGDIPPGDFIEVFDTPVRLCAGQDLRGRRFGIQYALFAQNLRAPAKGRLRLMLE